MLEECMVALVLLVDVSGSVSEQNYKLQQQGIADAFNSAEIQEIIANSKGGIAVSEIQWAGYNKISMPWVILKTKEDATAFANAALDTNRAKFSIPTTAVATSLMAGVKYLDEVPCKPERSVIDISGDGIDNQRDIMLPSEVRDNAHRSGIIINGLPIESEQDDVPEYYKENVITPTGFMIIAKGFKDFARAIRKKITLEIS